MKTYSFKTSYENLISRLPAMFAFVDIDANGTARIVEAINGKLGDYGKVIADIVCPYSFEYECKDGRILRLTSKDENEQLIPHSYRKVISLYYDAIRDISERVRDNWKTIEKSYEDMKEPCPPFDAVVDFEKSKYGFIQFVEKGIGLKYVGLSEDISSCGDCSIEVKKTFPNAPNYIYLGEAQQYYNRVFKIKKQIDFFEEHTKSCSMDRKYYEQLVEEFEMMNGDRLLQVLEELIAEAEIVSSEYYSYAIAYPKINFNVCLTNNIKDLGLVTPCINDWVPGKRYYNGDVVYNTNKYGYVLAWECRLEDVEYCDGYYDEATDSILFEDDTCDIQYWYPQFIDMSRGEESITVEGTCNSHLQSFRRYESYTNSSDRVEMPSNYRDWLWFYRVGRVFNMECSYDDLGNIGLLVKSGSEPYRAVGIEAIENDGANIVEMDGKAINLAAYGDVITNITASNGENGVGTISFEYWMGAHLLAEKAEPFYIVDEDGNYKYYFDNFAIDTESVYGKNHGVKYTETYIYYQSNSDDSIWKLVEDGKFDSYVIGNYDKDSMMVDNAEDYKLYEKFEFSTAENIYLYDMKIGDRIKKIPYIGTNYESSVDVRHIDVEDAPLIHYDYYSGVSYQPTVSSDAYIERGVTQAFEKHIKFSEIKTFEDLENYANGGFFSISQENIDLG